MKLKICGIQRSDDVEYLNEFLPDYAGFIFAKSRRQVSISEARELIRQLNKNILPVGVFVNVDIDWLCLAVQSAGLSVVQLHGNESEAYIGRLRAKLGDIEIWKAIRTAPGLAVPDYSQEAHRLLFDAYSKSTYGGTGQLADWNWINEHRPNKDFWLAGGLTPGNALDAISALAPYGLDISSGVETNGVKDRCKIAQLFNNLQSERMTPL